METAATTRKRIPTIIVLILLLAVAVAGAVYALSGTMCKISRGIFVVAPNNYDVIGNDSGEYEDL